MGFGKKEREKNNHNNVEGKKWRQTKLNSHFFNFTNLACKGAESSFLEMLSALRVKRETCNIALRDEKNKCKRNSTR